MGLLSGKCKMAATSKARTFAGTLQRLAVCTFLSSGIPFFRRILLEQTRNLLFSTLIKAWRVWHLFEETWPCSPRCYFPLGEFGGGRTHRLNLLHVMHAAESVLFVLELVEEPFFLAALLGKEPLGKDQPSSHRSPFQVRLARNRWHWFGWVLFHLPGPSIFTKGHLC